MFRNKNLKKLVIVLTSGFILVNITSCKENPSEEQRVISNENNQKVNDIENNQKVNDIENTKKEENVEISNTVDTVVDQGVEKQNEVVEETAIENSSKSAKEQDILDYYYQVEDEITTYLESEEVAEAKEKIADKFIVLVDFLFYDTTINGITFDELSNDTKEKIKEITSNLLVAICIKFPDFSNTVEEKYHELKPEISFQFNQITDYLGEKYNQSLSKVEELIGTENYNNFKEGKDDMKESFQDTYEGSKIFIKEWYDEFKKNHE